MDQKLLSRLEAQCSRREYCTSDIKEKIRKAGKEEETAEILASLEKDGYLSDERYARAFARDKSSLGGWGPVKIRYALGAKGVSKADIDAALADIDASAAEKALMKALEAKYRTVREEPDARLRLLKFALGRGYDYDDISSAIDRILKNNQ